MATKLKYAQIRGYFYARDLEFGIYILSGQHLKVQICRLIFASAVCIDLNRFSHGKAH